MVIEEYPTAIGTNVEKKMTGQLRFVDVKAYDEEETEYHVGQLKMHGYNRKEQRNERGK